MPTVSVISYEEFRRRLRIINMSIERFRHVTGYTTYQVEKAWRRTGPPLSAVRFLEFIEDLERFRLLDLVQIREMIETRFSRLYSDGGRQRHVYGPNDPTRAKNNNQ